MEYRDTATAFIDLLGRINSSSNLAAPRSQRTRELVGVGFSIEKPTERFIVTPHRVNNPIAMVAETIWVLAGRNDLEFLSHYLPRANDFSDDGLTWRGGYGPRIRNWNGVDQVTECLNLLRKDRDSRRAAMAIFDPDRDFIESRDIPCNNWLHWLIRDNQLLLAVSVRSNDLIWGFSGINTFEWSVLQEIMAYWLGASVGKQTWLIGSLHLYERHWQRADQILGAASKSPGIYDRVTRPLAFTTPANEFPALLASWFHLEEKIRNSPREITDSDLQAFPDPLFRAFLILIRAYWLAKDGAALEVSLGSLTSISGTDVAIVGEEFLQRKVGAPVQTPSLELAVAPQLVSYIASLHREKDATYGDSWKRRGEQIGICANIARKVDRLENIADGAPVSGETLLDTAVDALVYAVKYQTFLLDRDKFLRATVLHEWGPHPASQGPEGFEVLLRQYEDWQGDGEDLASATPRIVQAFADIEAAIESAANDGERFRLAGRLAGECFKLALTCWTNKGGHDGK